MPSAIVNFPPESIPVIPTKIKKQLVRWKKKTTKVKKKMV